jgi:hypothetical protein
MMVPLGADPFLVQAVTMELIGARFALRSLIDDPIEHWPALLHVAALAIDQAWWALVDAGYVKTERAPDGSIGP